MRSQRAKWARVYGSQDGEQLELGDKDNSPKVSKVKASLFCPTEIQEQIVVATWLSIKNIPYYHIPNGGYRDYREALKFKRMGVKAGVPDLCICVARGGYYGLYIELKRMVGGRISDAQLLWKEILEYEGYKWVEAKGSEECIKIIEGYLKLGMNNERL